MSVTRLTVDWVYRASESGAGWTATRRTRGAHAGADTVPHRMTRRRGAEVAANVDGHVSSAARGSGTNGNGERRLAGGGGWYQWVEGAIAILGVCSPVREDDGGGRRRGRSGGELRVLSGGRYGEV